MLAFIFCVFALNSLQNAMMFNPACGGRGDRSAKRAALETGMLQGAQKDVLA